MKPLVILTLPFLLLTGCQTLEQEIVLPGVDDPPPAILLGHVPGGLPADFYDNAAEVTGEAVLRYVALSDEITSEGGANPQQMKPLVSAEWWAVEQEGFSYFVGEGLRTHGTSEVSQFLVQSARITPVDTVEVGVIACVDTTGVIVAPAESPDPPETLWQWHPDYEDFDGDASQWAPIEEFLDDPRVSWGSPQAVVFWFEGPAMDSLLLSSSEPWWGVYTCF